MAKKIIKAKKQNGAAVDKDTLRRRRNLQVAFIAVSALLILSMVLAAVSKF